MPHLKIIGTSDGFCQCGCGQRTKIATATSARDGTVKGVALKFVHGHNSTGTLNWRWRGGRVKFGGHVFLRYENHPRANSWGYVREHVLLAEVALGHSFTESSPVHHFNENGFDNSPGNLVICQDQGYHALLHYRRRAHSQCGHANWLRCRYCKKWDRPENIIEAPWTRQVVRFHAACRDQRNTHRRLIRRDLNALITEAKLCQS